MCRSVPCRSQTASDDNGTISSPTSIPVSPPTSRALRSKIDALTLANDELKKRCDDLTSENLHLIWDVLPSAIPDLDLLKKNPGVRETPQGEFGEYDLGVSKRTTINCRESQEQSGGSYPL